MPGIGLERRIAHAARQEALRKIIKALPETDVRIEEDKSGVKVAADRFDSRIQTLPREDFPTLPEATEAAGTARRFPRDVQKQMIAKTQFAITGEDTRYFLNGALFTKRPDSMSLVSTDGHRLALITVPREAGKSKAKTPDEERVILPRNNVLRARGGCCPREKATFKDQARGESPVLRSGWSAADFADDRRTVPGVRARHSERETTSGWNSIAII